MAQRSPYIQSLQYPPPEGKPIMFQRKAQLCFVISETIARK
jgi:hypothetical protein